MCLQFQNVWFAFKFWGIFMINAIEIVDSGKDLDDELALVTTAGLQKLGLVQLLGVVANLEPSLERAKLTKGTLNHLGLGNIPVGVGTDCFKGGTNPKHETDAAYAQAVDASELLSGDFLFKSILNGVNEKVTIICNSGLTDIVKLINTDPDLFEKKVQEVVVMGGVKSLSANQLETVKGPDGIEYLVPDDAANNSFDWSAALYLYQWLQEHKIPLVVTMRWAPYACQFPFSLYDVLAETGNPIGTNLLNRQKPAINTLWLQVNAEAGSSVRGKLPVSRDRKWFVSVFCKNQDPPITGEQEVWPYVDSFNQYDAINVIAAVPELRKRFFTNLSHDVKGVTHFVIGSHKDNPSVVNSDDLREYMTKLQVAALQK